MEMVPLFSNVAVVTVFLLSSVAAKPLLSPSQADPLTAHWGDPQCWDSSSALLLEMRSPRIADTVPGLWEVMGTLRSSENSHHTELFWELARVFWDLYTHCVLSRSHGLGRRQLTTVHSLITDKSFRFNSSGRKSCAWLRVRVRSRGNIKTHQDQTARNRHNHKH